MKTTDKLSFPQACYDRDKISLFMHTHFKVKFPFVFNRKCSGFLGVENHGSEVDVSSGENHVLAEHTSHLINKKINNHLINY